MTSIQIISHTSLPSESVGRLLKALKQTAPVSFHYGKGVNKLEQYKFFKKKKLEHPEWTEDNEIANQWLAAGETVMARKRIKGQTGAGIVVLKPGPGSSDLVMKDEYKVFTKYIKKKREFRVNLFKHQFVNMREKVRATTASTDSHIRNSANGYTTTHCRPMPEALRQRIIALAVAAAPVSESDFIGVDICYNEYKDLVFLLEVNSGPSIEGSSVNDFVKAMLENVQA